MTEQPGPPPQIPPAFDKNGHGPSAKLAELMEQLPQMLVNAVASAMDHVLRQVPVRTTGYKCAECVTGRFLWVAEHKTETDAAYAAYVRVMQELSALEDGDPRKVAPVFASFLPEALRPGGPQCMPLIGDGDVMVGGTVLCSDHAPGGPGTQPPSRLLVASAGLTPGMLASLAA